MKKIFLSFSIITIMFTLAFSENSFTITERDGITTNNYPIQIGRPFLPGEIEDFPKVLIDGSPIETQADVKIRYSNGSVRHAIILFLIPTLTANSTVTITFQNQTSGNNSSYLDKTAMLDSNFDFNATMKLTNVSELNASARTMIDSGAFTYWFKGNIATSIVIADHSENRIFDIGFDSSKSFRPIFHATFWPTINKVFIRYIGEIANTEFFQDQTFDLALGIGNSTPSEFYTKNALIHCAGSRWTKTAWIGDAPSKIDINHNLAYLSKTRFIINLDTTKIMSTSAINNGYDIWKTKNTDLYDAGNWAKYMASTGGRPDLGPYPKWTAEWLITGVNELEERAFINSDLAAAWPIHFREGNPSKIMLKDSSFSGIGHVMSIRNRPTIKISDLEYNYTKVDDRIKLVGAISREGWVPDCAHQPDPFSAQYIVSGDYFYLEEMYFWASWSAAKPNGAANTTSIGRGPTGAEGGISDQVRGQAWALRNRAQTAFLAPDNSPEKQYFTKLIDDAISIWEGAKNITITPFNGNACWEWGKEIKGQLMGNLPLHQWEKGSSIFSQIGYGVDTAITLEAVGNFEQHFMMYALGRTKELGFPAEALLSHFAVHYVGQATNSDYNPFLIANGRMPTVKKSDSTYFSTWAELKTGYTQALQSASSFPYENGTYTYHFPALSALSFVKYEVGGIDAWQFAEDEILIKSELNDNLQWALVPREDTLSTNILNNNTAKNNNDIINISIFPNPFNPLVNITVSSNTLNSKSNLKLDIFNIMGKRVASLTSSKDDNISSSFSWNASNFSSGIYIVHLKFDNKIFTRSMVLSK